VFDSVGSGINDLYQGSSVQDAFRSGGDALKSIGIDVGGSAATTPTAIGGGASSYSGAVDPTGKYSFGSALDKVGGASTAALNESSPLLSALSPYAPAAATAAPSLSTSTALTGASSGAKPMANSFLAPVLSAALGYNTNQNAANALLEQQRANMALLSPYAKDFTFTPGDLTTDPGYQFNLAQGTAAQDRANLARGNYYSGQALKEAQQFGQGLADTTYNTAFNRALQGRNAGMAGALASAGINTDIGNIKANQAVNTNNLISGALGNLLGGSSFTNTGALQGRLDLQELLRRAQLGSSLYAS